MPIDQRRRDEIAAAVAAYNSANPKARLPRNAILLLAAMFPAEDICQRSLMDIAGGGFGRKALPGGLKRLVEAGFLVEAAGFGRCARHVAPAPAAGTAMRGRREKVFGPGRAIPLDRNAKARIAAYARAWDRLHRQPGQRGGALGRAALDVLGALLWMFHNARSGVCFPSYETIADRAGCARSTVAEALKALEWAGVLTWQNRITRIRERCRDLFGLEGWRWRVIRTSNCYQFRDPQAAVRAGVPSKSDYRTGTQNQELNPSVTASAVDPHSPLERALARFAAAVAAKQGCEQAAAG